MRRLPILPHERQLEQHPEAEYVVLPQSENRQESHLSDYFGILARLCPITPHSRALP